MSEAGELIQVGMGEFHVFTLREAAIMAYLSAIDNHVTPEYKSCVKGKMD
jgi:hypothetical protein